MQDSTPEDTAAQGPQPVISRRGLLKAGAAAGTGAVALGPGSDMLPEQMQPVGDAQAFPWLIAGGAVATGWVLREYEVLGKDDPPQGLTADALRLRVFETAQTRDSTNASTFIDNKNLIEYAKNDIYSNGKLAAIQALNNQESQSAVQTAATDAANAAEATIESNFLKGWRESAHELDSLITAVTDHPDTTISGVFGGDNSLSVDADYTTSGTISKTATLRDGTEMDIPYVVRTANTTARTWNPITESGGGSAIIVSDPNSSGTVGYLAHSTWNDLWTTMQTAFDTVNNGLITWVDNVYSQVQSGTIETADLLTPSELAELSSTEGSTYNKALQDLLALNIPVNLDREAKIQVSSMDGATLYGSLGVTGGATLQAGTTVTPSSDAKEYYFTYDVSQAHGTWSEYETGVDGGTVTFTAEPHPKMVYKIATGAQETAEVQSSAFTDNGDGTWSADLSSQLETEITTVNSVNFYSATSETSMATIQLKEQFTIVSFTNSSGEQVDSAEYTQPYEPENDTNYITQEEWEQREQAYKDLIDKYEAAINDGGGLPVLGNFSPTQLIGGVVILGGAALGISWFQGLKNNGGGRGGN